MPATLGRAVQRQAEVGQATGEESLAQAVLKGECWQHGPGGVGSRERRGIGSFEGIRRSMHSFMVLMLITN